MRGKQDNLYRPELDDTSPVSWLGSELRERAPEATGTEREKVEPMTVQLPPMNINGCWRLRYTLIWKIEGIGATHNLMFSDPELMPLKRTNLVFD